MSVHDGDNQSAKEIARVTGTAQQFSRNFAITSTGRDIFINFLSDDTETASGFKIQFEAGMK